MILDKEIEIKIYAPTMKYYRDLGYDVSVGSIIRVPPEELPPKSNLKINCKCDKCGKEYRQRFGRYNPLCRSCVSRDTLSKFSIKRKSSFRPDRDEFIKIVNEHGKMYAARYFGTTLAIVINYVKNNGIEVESYKGIKKHQIDDINDLREKSKTMNISELSRHFDVPVLSLKRIAKKENIDLNSQFDVWGSDYREICNNIEYYKSENVTKTLNQISSENDISIKQLKRAFKDLDIDVVIHSSNQSKGEDEVREFIQNLGYTAYSTKKKHGDITLEMDCFIPEKNFAIEYCGEYWHSDTNIIDHNYHHKKYQWCKDQGIALMTIFESEWLSKRDIIESMIKSRLGVSDKRIYARECEVKYITLNEASCHHDKNHINGGVNNSSFNIGLFFNGYLVSAISVSKSRFRKDVDWEIIRFSTSMNHNVIGGFGRMLSFFRKEHTGSIISFSDLRFGEGGVYEKCGFKLGKTTPPNYWYFDKKMGILENRMRYQKHKLKNKLDNFDPGKTEYQNMMDHGYYRIFDCGNNVWVLPA